MDTLTLFCWKIRGRHVIPGSAGNFYLHFIEIFGLFCAWKRIQFRFVVLPFSTYLFTLGVEVVYFYLITLRHTPQSVGLL
jgi:hypothetical protein